MIFFWSRKTMTYATPDDYLLEFGDDDIADGSDRLSAALLRASRLVDTYCRASGLDTPLMDAAAISDVKGPCLDIARYFVWNDSSNEENRRRYEDAIKFFEGVASGKVRLIAGGQVTSGSGISNIRIIRA